MKAEKPKTKKTVYTMANIIRDEPECAACTAVVDVCDECMGDLSDEDFVFCDKKGRHICEECRRKEATQ